MNHFVILAVPRSGSNLLCTLLNSHPEILCHHEVFNPHGIFTAREHGSRRFELGSIDQRDRDPIGFLARVWQTGAGEEAVGFKWTRGQSEEVLGHVTHDHAVRKVILRRRNHVKTFVSEQVARQTDQWELYDAADLQPRPQVEISFGDLLKHIETNETFYTDLIDQLNRDEQPYLEVEYEQLFAPHEHRRMLRFLEVEPIDYPLRASSVKQNPTDLRRLVRNYDALISMLDDENLRAQLMDCGM